MPYLSGYPAPVVEQVRTLIDESRLAEWILAKYPTCHEVRTERSLYTYASELKKRFLRNAPALSKAVYDPKIQALDNALGLHTRISRVQGSQLRAKYEIRVSTVFRVAPQAFLDMILIHELAHFREHDHNKAFYRLCERMNPDYHQIEFDLRVYLTYRDRFGELYGV